MFFSNSLEFVESKQIKEKHGENGKQHTFLSLLSVASKESEKNRMNL